MGLPRRDVEYHTYAALDAIEEEDDPKVKEKMIADLERQVARSAAQANWVGEGEDRHRDIASSILADAASRGINLRPMGVPYRDPSSGELILNTKNGPAIVSVRSDGTAEMRMPQWERDLVFDNEEDAFDHMYTEREHDELFAPYEAYTIPEVRYRGEEARSYVKNEQGDTIGTVWLGDPSRPNPFIAEIDFPNGNRGARTFATFDDANEWFRNAVDVLRRQRGMQLATPEHLEAKAKPEARTNESLIPDLQIEAKLFGLAGLRKVLPSDSRASLEEFDGWMKTYIPAGVEHQTIERLLPRLAVINDVLEFRGELHRRNQRQLYHLSLLPDHILEEVRSRGRVIFGNGPVQGFAPEFSDEEKNSAGLYSPADGAAYIGSRAGNTMSVALHEIGHMIGNQRRSDSSKEMRSIHSVAYESLPQYLKDAGPAGSYVGCAELFAEAFTARAAFGKEYVAKLYGQPMADYMERSAFTDRRKPAGAEQKPASSEIRRGDEGQELLPAISGEGDVKGIGRKAYEAAQAKKHSEQAVRNSERPLPNLFLEAQRRMKR